MLREMKGLEESHTTNPEQPNSAGGERYTDPEAGRKTERCRASGRPRPERIKDRQKNLPPLTPCRMRPIYINSEVHTNICLP